jgi:uncharacterized protein YndB with AHSA1/START domain
MTQTSTDTVLELDRTFPADKARVFAAFTDPEQVRLWYPPGDYYIPDIELDVRPGGTYRLTMANDVTGVRMELRGEYREVVPETKLVYTWVWHRPDGVSPETLVTVTFEADGDGTKVRIRHEFFPDSEMRDQHIGGWTACLEQLSGLV